jgi:hypothetical protein
MKKVPAVSRVQISLKDGLTMVDLKPGNTTTLSELRRIIRNNGFVSKEATVVAAGTPAADQKAFTVSGTNEQFDDLSEAPRRTGDHWQLVVRAPAKP